MTTLDHSVIAHPGTERSTGTERSLGLDIARAAAITLVFASHKMVDLVGPIGVTAVQWGGRAGVELFFSLSGFLIGSILINTAEKGLDPRSVGGFLFRRWMRTLPLYYAVLWFSGWFFSMQNPHAYLLLQNFYPAEPRVLAASWSLVMEEYFYLFFPLTMLLLTAVLGQGVRVVWVTAGLLITVCVAGRLAIAAGLFHVPLNDMHENPFIRMDCAAYGVVAALLMRQGTALRAWLTPARARSLLAASVVLELACCAIFIAVVHLPAEQLLTLGFGTWGSAYLVMQWSPLGPLFAVSVTALWVLRLQAPRPVAAVIRTVSLWSYSIYLLHAMVIVLVEYYRLVEGGPQRLFAVTLLTIAASGASYWLIERPVLWLRDRMVRGSKPVPGRPALAR